MFLVQAVLLVTSAQDGTQIKATNDQIYEHECVQASDKDQSKVMVNMIEQGGESPGNKRKQRQAWKYGDATWRTSDGAFHHGH